jgi:hypothetical protein
MFQNEIRLKWFIDEVFDDDNNPENFPQERYYDINLHQPPDLFDDQETSTIKYFHAEEVSYDRKLSNFEIGLLTKAISSVKIPFKSDAYEYSLTHPYDNYRIVIKHYNFDLEFRWSDNDASGDPKAYKSLMKLVKLISIIEPIDYERLGVEPSGFKE